MLRLEHFCTSAVLCVTAAIGAVGSVAAKPSATEFEEATIVVERNDTDGDTEVVIDLTAGDEGLRTLHMRTPDGRWIAHVISQPSSEGMREFHFESPEPAGDRILASYPEGTYTFAAPTIINPVHDEVVASDALMIEWPRVGGGCREGVA